MCATGEFFLGNFSESQRNPTKNFIVLLHREQKGQEAHNTAARKACLKYLEYQSTRDSDAERIGTEPQEQLPQKAQYAIGAIRQV